MSELEEHLLRIRLRALLTRCGIGRLRRTVYKVHPYMYTKSGDFRTKYTDGVTPEGRKLLRAYKDAEKEITKWQQRRNDRRFFRAHYEKPDKHHPGYLEVSYYTNQDAIEGEEL